MQSVGHLLQFSFAYLDGGTFSMLWQAAIAALLSGAYVVKTRWAQLRAFFASRKKPSDPAE